MTIRGVSTVATSAAVTDGTIDNTVIGGTTPAAGTFTTDSATTAFRAPDGSVSVPSYSWTSETNLGFYKVATDQIGVTLGGTLYYTMTPTAFTAPTLVASNTTGTVVNLGNTTSTSTATPVVINMGATFSSTAGANPKIRVYDNGSGIVAGIGVSSVNLDFMSYSAFSFYPNSGTLATIKFNTGGGITFDATNTATVGAVTINRACGRVNIAAAGTSVVVTNSVVNANSKIFCTIATADATATIKNVVPTAGSFTITIVAATAQTAIDFLVVNPN